MADKREIKIVNCATLRGKVIVPDEANNSCYTFLIQFSKKLTVSELLSAFPNINENIIVTGYGNDYKHWE